MLLSSRRNRFEDGVSKMQKRVYFVGAQSTGKTTLSEYMARKLQWKYIREQARVVLAEKGWKLALAFADEVVGRERGSHTHAS